MRCHSPTEHEEQSAVIQWRDLMKARYPCLELLHAIPNGAFLAGKDARERAIRAKRMKAEGMLPGVFDLFLPVARNGYHGMYVEMKRKGGSVSQDQCWWRHQVRKQGYAAHIAHGQDQAKTIISNYLGINEVI